MVWICRLRSRDLFLSPSQNIPRNSSHLALSCAGCVCMFSADACPWRMVFTRHCAESLGDDITFWYAECGRGLLGLPEPEIPTNSPRRIPALTVHCFPILLIVVECGLFQICCFFRINRLKWWKWTVLMKCMFRILFWRRDSHPPWFVSVFTILRPCHAIPVHAFSFSFTNRVV